MPASTLSLLQINILKLAGNKKTIHKIVQEIKLSHKEYLQSFIRYNGINNKNMGNCCIAGI